MSLSPDEFLQQLEERGVLAADHSRTSQNPILLGEVPVNVEDLIQILVRQGKLTEFQAEEARQGNARSLVLGNYVLLEKIGAGGMGQVFKARHRVMDRIVAVKILPAAMTRDKAAIARFQREVKAAAKISHSNIVTAHDADQADGVHFLVMEHVDGRDLSALVKKSGPLSVSRAVNFVLQAARGLEAAHKKGIVHRDIKPANLLLDAEGVVKILDLGLARIDHADGPAQDELTNTGTIMGTVDYMAPEQALDTKTADARADIYALGCTLYLLLTGKPAYIGDTAMKKLLAHREQPIPSLRAARPEVPEQLEAIFRKMIAKKVEDRYQTMSEVIAELGHCSGVPVSPLTIRDFNNLPADSNSSHTITQQLPFEQTVLTMATEQPAPVTVAITPRAENKKQLLIGGGIFGVALVTIIVLLANRDGTKPQIDGPGIAQQPDSSPGGDVQFAFQKPGFDQWVNEVQALPAEKQLEAVSKKLVELNPGFDGRFAGGGGSPIMRNGVVATFSIITDKVTDISPVRAFTALDWLEVMGSSQISGKLEDLSPLKGTRLTILNCRNNPRLSDLSPLKDLPLTNLDCPSTAVTDLSQISPLKLTILNISSTNISDLSPLRGMPLEYLTSPGTKVSDLSPLQGLRLQSLNMQNSPASDLSPLKGMPLTYLRTGLEVSDLSPLRGMKLTSLSFFGPVADLSPLEGMPLTLLQGWATKVSDLSPLKGMKLTGLHFEGPVGVLTPLEEMPLEELSLGSAKVSDVAPLRGMPLKRLSLVSTPISDLSPLEALPLESLTLTGTNVSDLSPLRAMKLTSVAVTPQNITQGMDVLRQMASLKAIDLFGSGSISPAEFWKKYDAGEFDKPITDFNSPEFQQWVQQVQALPAEKQLEAVSKKLVELNPGFDGTVTGGGGSPAVQNGVVTTFGIFTDNVTDISPVRALASLSVLDVFSSSAGKGKLRDLSPLQGMRLQSLVCRNNPALSDLSPLKDVPLTILDCNDTRVSDLSPLNAMNLTHLNLTSTKVLDLSPLKGLPLQDLALGNTQITDLSPLRGLPLRALKMQNVPTGDLTSLKGMPLTSLATGFEVTDLSPLKGMKLTHLEFGGLVTDLSPLEGMPLGSLFFGNTAVSDLSPLKGMKLTSLWIGGPVSDLSAIAGMPLTEFKCFHTKISDLSPLKGMKLTLLIIVGSPVSDLSVLKGMPLEYLQFKDTSVSDLSPLRGMKLTTIVFTPKNITTGMDVLRQMDSIKEIGVAHWELKSPAEFWKRYDAGEFDEPKPR